MFPDASFAQALAPSAAVPPIVLAQRVDPLASYLTIKISVLAEPALIKLPVPKLMLGLVYQPVTKTLELASQLTA